jgi:hypothetical protein
MQCEGHQEVTWGQEVFLLEDFSRAGWGVIDPMGHPPQENGVFFGGFDSVDCWCHTANKPHHNSVPERRSSGTVKKVRDRD